MKIGFDFSISKLLKGSFAAKIRQRTPGGTVIFLKTE